MTRERLPTDLHWAALHARTLCVEDDVGRLERWNGPSGEPTRAPILLLARTLHGNLWRLRSGLPASLVRELSRLCGAERTAAAEPGTTDPTPELARPPERWPTIEERILEHLPVAEHWSGLAFRFPETLRPSGESELLPRRAFGELAGSFPKLVDSVAEREPCAVVRREGAIVSACYAATRPSPEGGLEAAVETRDEHRGHAYAASTVSRFAAEVRRRGGIPLYSTALSNRASRALARKLGLVPYAAIFQLR